MVLRAEDIVFPFVLSQIAEALGEDADASGEDPEAAGEEQKSKKLHKAKTVRIICFAILSAGRLLIHNSSLLTHVCGHVPPHKAHRLSGVCCCESL